MQSLSINQVERELGFRFTIEERRRMHAIHHVDPQFHDGEAGWCVLKVPYTLVITHGPVGLEALSMFRGHSQEIKTRLWVRYGNSHESM